MPQNKPAETAGLETYGKDNFLKPHKMVITYDSRQALLTNDGSHETMYTSLFVETKTLIRSAFSAAQTITGEKLSLEKWDEVRSQRGVAFLYGSSIEADAFLSMLGASNIKLQGVKGIDAVKISTADDKLYILDNRTESCFAYSIPDTLTDLGYLLFRLEKGDADTGVFLSKIDPRQYGRNVIVPTWTQPNSIAVLEAVNEMRTPKDTIPDSIAALFNEEVSALSIIKNTEGTTIYTDREDQVVKLYSNGLFEYARYNIPGQAQSSVSVADAIDISTAFINRHFGFPKDTVLSEIIRTMQGDKYIIRYKYRNEGIPVVLDSASGAEAIEIEIAGGEVKRYKRVVRSVTQVLEAKEVMSSVEILDILLNKKITAFSGENIIAVNDLYIAYFERRFQDRINYIPVWVADVTVEKADSSMHQRMRYIINGETGIIMDK